ncbi:uncharacterized protein BO87DRAFT_212309 [Aspergillus neoniger CBS 115656]|uniref:Uncharacterized protein n=1 Tax=Aspergillus neoniger (strain CBS 115656) TaxID=1448310 RepID=A0A318Y4F2_ASPNB|nr:hypothetical protein BO87DRAFT_212309 [Aspergillus neoniger CBS 115656]PYH28634.1 hypothetical protein BO87DRAFT_212309 [Aspergillus neoniger CBS 115656]
MRRPLWSSVHCPDAFSFCFCLRLQRKHKNSRGEEPACVILLHHWVLGSSLLASQFKVRSRSFRYATGRQSLSDSLSLVLPSAAGRTPYPLPPARGHPISV